MIPQDYAEQIKHEFGEYLSDGDRYTSVDGGRTVEINSVMEMTLSDTLLVDLTLIGQDICQVYTIRCYPYQFRGVLTDARRWLRGDLVESVIRAINGERVSE